MCSWLYSPVTTLLCTTAAKLIAVNPKVELNGLAGLKLLFEQYKSKDIDAARVVEKIFEPKLKLEARVDLDIKDTWKSLKSLGGVENAVGSAL